METELSRISTYNYTTHALYDFWTVEEENLLRELSGTMSFKEMAAHFPKRNASRLQCHARAMGLSSNHIMRKWTFDKNFWKIPNQINSYYAGFSAADGSIRKYSEGEGYTFTLCLGVRDVIQLKNLKNVCQYTGPIRCYKKLKPIKENGYSILAYLNINSSFDWVKDLEENFGIVPNKTFRFEPPKLDSEFLKWCFLIGYIDGDGCLAVDKKGDSPLVSITSSNIAILEWIKNLIEDKFEKIRKKETKISKCTHANAYTISYSGWIVCQLHDYLKNFPVPKLDRKWNNIKLIECTERYKEKMKNFREYYKIDQNKIAKNILESTSLCEQYKSGIENVIDNESWVINVNETADTIPNAGAKNKINNNLSINDELSEPQESQPIT